MQFEYKWDKRAYWYLLIGKIWRPDGKGGLTPKYFRYYVPGIYPKPIKHTLNHLYEYWRKLFGPYSYFHGYECKSYFNNCNKHA